MKITQMTWDNESGWNCVYGNQDIDPTVIICFGSRNVITDPCHFDYLKKKYPNTDIIMSSSGGEILNDEVRDDTIIANLIKFEKTPIKCVTIDIQSPENSKAVGEAIAEQLKSDDLAGVFVLTEGLEINGSQLVSGMLDVIHENIPITGGLASDGEDFKKTVVGLNCIPESSKVVAIGFYGNHVKIGHGSMGGWLPFGPEREITKSKNNILYELCGHPALALYKKYLGDAAQNLPGDALLYPLSIKSTPDSNDTVVRSILAINEEDQSLVFAGDVPEGSIAQLMYGNFEDLIDGAETAANQACIKDESGDHLAILISSIGRRVLMGQQINDELEVVYNYWDKKVPLTGFYSYGEISPHAETGVCDLHNQTMTITTIGESV